MKNRLISSLMIAGVLLAAQTAATPAFALVTSDTDPTTVLSAALSFILGPFGKAIGVLGLIGSVLTISRHGFTGVIMYVVAISIIFGSSYVVNQLLTGGG